MTPSRPTTTTLAVMVTLAYADRVRNALLGSSEGWQSETPTRKRQVPAQERSCRVVSISHPHTGSRKLMRGHTLLIIENAATSLADLSPMARQNIAWGVTLQYDCQKVDMERLGKEIFSSLAEKGFHEKDHVLRVDTFPKELSSCVCQSLQSAAGARDSTDPYEGAVIMTKSASKCNYVVSLVCHETGYAWGVTDRATHFAVKFNDGASDELTTKSTDAVTGVDVSSDSPQDAPVSRAYYKLSQVWDEILCNEFTSRPPIGKGVDLGAAPGGWTQVLRQHIGLSQVVSIDPAVLAHRVTSLPGVFNVTADMASAQAVEGIASVTGPISFLVCDACVDSFNILEKIVQLMERIGGNAFALPAACVITLKMPYKTRTSLDRNLEKVKKKIPQQLRKMASLSYEQQVNIRHQIVHLMANSDSERTLIVIFEAC